MGPDDATSWIIDDAAEIVAHLRAAQPDQPVPGCPGWTAADLSQHVAMGFAGWYCYNISTARDEWTAEALMARLTALGEDHVSNITLFETGVDRFATYCSELDLDVPTWSFGGTVPAGWWIRRAATELTVHLSDAAGIHGERSATTAERHAEAIDEVLTELFTRLPAVRQAMSALSGRAAPLLAPPDRPVALMAEDTGRSWTLSVDQDGATTVARSVEGQPAAVGRGVSHDVLAWLFGRPMSEPLAVEGDSSLLDGWNLLQRAEF